jgi:TonB-linked SusC/RagA family outer membrane protein
MKKNRMIWYLFSTKEKFTQIMKLISILIFAFVLQFSALGFSQSSKLSLQMKESNLKAVFKEIKELTGFTFVYSEKLLAETQAVNINVQDMELEKILEQCLSPNLLDFYFEDDVIIITPTEKAIDNSTLNKAIKIKGNITDSDRLPLPGATILEKGTTNGTTSDVDGNYILTVSGENSVIQISYIGFETQEITVGAKKIINCVLKLSSNELDEVIVTGYSKRKKSSYTGAAVSVTGKELKKYGNTNLIKSLQVFDPSFRIEEDIEYGSDPNKLPKITVRGKSSFPDLSKSKLKRNLNMPTFILDGFEVDVERIYDLDLNRVKSVTILKDAASTAIYGSRASNGVIVVETKTPKAGALQVNYNLDVTISAPDLSDYHLMDAEKKLEAEVRAGYYPFVVKGVRNKEYQKKLLDVKKGVNTYWLSQPLQILLSHKHTLSFEGGDENTRYGVYLKYDGKKGIMKGSERNNYTIGFNFSYTFKKIRISNNLAITKLKTKNSNYGNFSQYGKLNPYLRLKDAKGKMIQKYLYSKINNPLYEASLNNKDGANSFSFLNSLSIEIPLFQDCLFTITAAYTERHDEQESFISPKSTKFDNDTFKGKSSLTNTTLVNLEGTAVFNFFKTIKKHVISTVLGCNISENTAKSHSFSVVGFSSDRQNNIVFGNKYESTIPNTSESVVRLIGSFFNVNYDFDNRYFLDFSVRLDRSSQFGKFQREAPFWSFGIGWNVQKDLLKNNNDIVNAMKITANIGTTGNVNIEPYQAFSAYEFFRKRRYVDNQLAAKMMALGNNNLKWQTTFKRNIALEFTLFDKYQFNFNYYHNTTKDLIIDVAMPPSSGFKSFKSNLGEIENRGWDIRVNFNLMENSEKNFYLSFFANFTHNENKIGEIKEYLKNYNNEIIENLNKSKGLATNGGSPTFYKKGASLDAIYAVPSFGIDPITGQEVFIKKDGTHTFNWDPKDMKSYGSSSPDINGFFGLNLIYGRLGVNVSFQLQFGNTVEYNSTLIKKIENADLRYNADERVLNEKNRWKKPGDIVFYRKILGPNDLYTRTTSRFVKNKSLFSVSSFSVNYNPLSEVSIKKLGLRDLRLSINLNDLLRFSSLKKERGLSYPFARSLSFSIQAYF